MFEFFRICFYIIIIIIYLLNTKIMKWFWIILGAIYLIGLITMIITIRNAEEYPYDDDMF